MQKLMIVKMAKQYEAIPDSEGAVIVDNEGTGFGKEIKKDIHHTSWGKIAVVCLVLMGCAIAFVKTSSASSAVALKGSSRDFLQEENSLTPPLGGESRYPCKLTINNMITRNIKDSGSEAELTAYLYFNGKPKAQTPQIDLCKDGCTFDPSNLYGFHDIQINSPSDYFEMKTKETDTWSSDDWINSPRVSDICNAQSCGPPVFGQVYCDAEGKITGQVVEYWFKTDAFEPFVTW